jgi:hypothetical protein
MPISHPTAGADKPKVIYVMGQGKSGSTILGVTLNNCTDVFFAGELCTWLIGSGKPYYGGTERVRFWQEVRSDLDGAAGLFGEDAFRYLERGLSAFRLDWWPRRRRLRGPYRQATEDLYRSIANRAGATHVVDTSHLPMRARELRHMDGIDLYLIFLVRDVEGVVGSYMRHRKRDDPNRGRRFSKMNAYLWITYLLSVAVFLRQRSDRRLVVRHEDFIAKPEAVLHEVLSFADAPAEIPDLTALRTGIAFRANALVRSEVVALKAKPAPVYRPSRLMRLARYPWAFILGRLRPAATGAATGTLSGEHSTARLDSSP